MIEKYGKSVADITKAKQSYFDDNDELVKKQNNCAMKYAEGPVRKHCKMCGLDLKSGICYFSHGVEYIICSGCGHVNGKYEETAEYHKYMYSDSDYGTYTYSEQSKHKYDARVENIYKPKALFLRDVLAGEGLEPESIKVLDIGAGSGYFVSACNDAGMRAKGIEMSRKQVEFGKQYVHTNSDDEDLRCIESSDLNKEIKEDKCANVLSAIGVMEHLLDFHSVLEELKQDKNYTYFYMMVPMFGFSNILETLLPDVFNRHLGGPHTHVFSHKSIAFMEEKYNMSMIAKWQFGTDIMDLYRMCIVKNNKELDEVIFQNFYKCIDDMQLVLDKNDFCSEIHAVFKLTH